MAEQQMPIFVRTYDFLTWLLPATNHFPRAHRHTFTARLLDAAFELNDRLEAASRRLGRDANLPEAIPGLRAGAAGRVLQQQSEERPLRLP